MCCGEIIYDLCRPNEREAFAVTFHFIGAAAICCKNVSLLKCLIFLFVFYAITELYCKVYCKLQDSRENLLA